MYKKLERFPDKGVLGGICYGLGEYFNIDPVIVRIAFVILFFVGGGGLLAYLIMWLIVPKSNGTEV
jgi:phage shock protein PspC (stress-responsive transcriptional regulator)